MSGYDFLKSQVFSCWRKVRSDCDVVISSGRVFQTRGPAAENARSPTVERLTDGSIRRLVPRHVACRRGFTKLDYIPRSHSAFNIIRTSRNSYCMCICLLLHGRRRMAMNDEWELYATNSKSKSDVNESVNPSDFRFVYYCGTPTTFELQFELRNIPTVEQMQYTPWVNKKNKTLKSCP